MGALDPNMFGRYRVASIPPLAFLAILAVAGCGEAGGEGPGASGPEGAGLTAEAFPGSAPSLDALGRGVLRGFASSDTAALASYRLGEAEHNEIVFPELPAGRSEVGYPVDLAWQNIELRNGRSLGRQLPWFQGRDVEHLETVCRGQTEAFETFRVHTDCWVIFKEATYGRLEVQLFKDALERGGGWKLFRYYDELPRRDGS